MGKTGEIKEAEGYKQSKILHAEEMLVLSNWLMRRPTNTLPECQLLRKLEALEKALSENAKIVVLQALTW